MDTFTLPKTLTRRLGRVAQQTGARAESLVRDAVKGHLDYLEWLGRSLDEAEQEAGREGWLGTAQVRSALAAEIGGHGRGRAKVR